MFGSLGLVQYIYKNKVNDNLPTRYCVNDFICTNFNTLDILSNEGLAMSNV